MRYQHRSITLGTSYLASTNRAYICVYLVENLNTNNSNKNKHNMKCHLCHRTFRFASANNSNICNTCLDVHPDNQYVKDDDLDLELLVLRDKNKVRAVFDSDGPNWDNEDYGHGY